MELAAQYRMTAAQLQILGHIAHVDDPQETRCHVIAQTFDLASGSCHQQLGRLVELGMITSNEARQHTYELTALGWSIIKQIADEAS